MVTKILVLGLVLLGPLLVQMPDVVAGLQYNYGDGSYYVGSVDNQGRPSGLGHFYNSSGQLGTVQNT